MFGFEFGHMVIDKQSKIKCNCGKYGCFETFASMKRFKENAKEKLNLPKDLSSEELQNYIRENQEEEKIKKFIDDYLSNLSIRNS